VNRKILLTVILVIIFCHSAYGNEVVDGLQMIVSQYESIENKSSNAQFIITLKNVGNNDFILNLGMMLANGKNLFPNAIQLNLSDDEGNKKKLESKKPGFIGGRVDDYILPLEVGSSHSLIVDLNDYWSPDTEEFKFQLYEGINYLQVQYNGQGAQHNLGGDMVGVKLLNFWVGKIQSNIITIKE